MRSHVHGRQQRRCSCRGTARSNRPVVPFGINLGCLSTVGGGCHGAERPSSLGNTQTNSLKSAGVSAMYLAHATILLAALTTGVAIVAGGQPTTGAGGFSELQRAKVADADGLEVVISDSSARKSWKADVIRFSAFGL